MRGAHVTWSGPSGGSATTGANGAYSAKVDPGTYRVTAARYCAIGASGCAHTTTAHVSGGGGRADSQTAGDVVLTGRVTTVACTTTACPAPTPGAGVTVSANGGGETTQTAADGSYRLELQPGRYDVQPLGGGAYEPARRSVDLQGDVQRANFTACSIDGKPGCAPDSVDFDMPDRLTTQQDFASRLPSPRYVNPSSWTVTLVAKRDGLGAACPTGLDLEWTVTAPKGAKVLREPGTGCTPTMTVSRLGHYRVSVRVAGDDGTAVPKGGADVDVRDLLIVGMGDSAASGEGNPDKPGAKFADPQCNRSSYSSQYLAAQYVEDQDRHTSVTFLFAACSGAITTDLFDTDDTGVRSGYALLRPQIEDVAERMHARDGLEARKPDAAIVSAGVNDIGFGPFLTYCVARAHFVAPSLGHDCADDKVDVERDAKDPVALREGHTQRDGTVAFKLDDAHGTKLGPKIHALIKSLPTRYAPLRAAIARRLSDHQPAGLGLPASRVLITTYPNFTSDSDGQTCGPSGGLITLSHATWLFIDQATTLLDQQVVRSGFTPVSVDPQEFVGHGYCSSTSLFVGAVVANVLDDAAGPFHPDEQAHLLIARAIEPELCRALYGTPDCSGKPKD